MEQMSGNTGHEKFDIELKFRRKQLLLNKNLDIVKCTN